MAYGAPFLVTAQASENPAAVSTGLGSVITALGVMGVPSGLLAGAVMTAVGATFRTERVSVPLPGRPLLPVMVTVIV